MLKQRVDSHVPEVWTQLVRRNGNSEQSFGPALRVKLDQHANLSWPECQTNWVSAYNTLILCASEFIFNTFVYTPAPESVIAQGRKGGKGVVEGRFQAFRRVNKNKNAIEAQIYILINIYAYINWVCALYADRVRTIQTDRKYGLFFYIFLISRYKCWI